MLIEFDPGDERWYIFFRVSYHINKVGGLFSQFVDLLLVMTLVEVGNGFLFCHTESRNLLQRVLRNAAIASCTILAVVAFVAFGMMNASVAGFSSPEWAFDVLWKTAAKLYAFVEIFLFVWAGILMGVSTHVYHEVKRNGVLRNVSFPWVLQGCLKPA